MVNLDQVQNFLDKFVKVYQGHGGRVTMKRPPIHFGEPDVATAIATAWTKAANKNGKRCQILMIILADKDSFAYLRIKKSCDCRFGVASQCEAPRVSFQHGLLTLSLQVCKQNKSSRPTTNTCQTSA